MTYPQLAGFLFALGNGPELVLPSEWMPIVFNDRDAGYDTPSEAEGIVQAMMALHNDAVRERVEGYPALPPGCERRKEPLANLDSAAPFSQWARGFLMGYDYLEEFWDAYTPEALDEPLGSAAMVLSCCANLRLAKAYHKEGKGGTTFEQFMKTVMALVPDAMAQYAVVGKTIYRTRCDSDNRRAPKEPGPKIGRNDPCPCGSGRKFKRCCGAT